MSDDFEKQLRTVRLAVPSLELDRRIEAVLGPARRARHWWWLCALPAAGAAAALALIFQRPSPVPVAVRDQPLVFKIQPSGLMRDLLLTPPARWQTPPVLVVSVRS